MIRPNTIAAHARLLLLDPDRHARASMADTLRREGYDVRTCETLSDAATTIADGTVDVLLADLDLPGVRVVDTLVDLRRRCAETAVVLISRYGSVEAAKEAARGGAADYLVKPVADDELRSVLARTVRQQVLASEPRPTFDRTSAGINTVIGRDVRMQKIFDVVDAVADTRTNVLILGESGTGKSLLARAIHARSPRRDRSFVEVACGSLPETLLESELFGHVKGGFTGAVADKPGRFVTADGGSLFLDEINSASPAMQVKLLRVLQERRLEPVGSDTTRQVDVRTILASNGDLQAMVTAGTFRQDLFYRINVVTLHLPPLRERPGDIALLADAFLRKFADETERRVIGFTPAALDRLTAHAWPGNVRELENAIERAVVLGRRPTIDVDDLPDAVTPSRPAAPADPTSAGPPLPLAVALEGPEKRIIEIALARNAWNRNATAAELDINRTTLYKKMRKYGLEVAERSGLAEPPLIR